MVTYLDKKGKVSTINIALAFEQNNTEMQKRLKYTKEILTHMLNTGNKKTQEIGDF
jgi:polo-like kinase 1